MGGAQGRWAQWELKCAARDAVSVVTWSVTSPAGRLVSTVTKPWLDLAPNHCCILKSRNCAKQLLTTGWSLEEPCTQGGVSSISETRVSGSSGRGRLRQLLGGGRAGTLWRGASESTAFSQQGSLFLLVDTVKHWLSSKIHINIFIDRNTQSLSLIPPFFYWGAVCIHYSQCLVWFCEFSQMPAAGWLTPQRGTDSATPDAPAPLCDASLSLPPAPGPASP